jgi:hypothetical protein
MRVGVRVDALVWWPLIYFDVKFLFCLYDGLHVLLENITYHIISRVYLNEDAKQMY